MFTPTRILIFGKTYPELSSRHIETVCTGGFREDGRPVRLYPVPLRYLEGPQQYKLYEWITVPIMKSTSDSRPESYKIDPQKIVRHAVVPSDKHGWQARREMVFKDPSWHFGGMDELKEAERTGRASIGMVRPGSIDDIVVRERSEAERLEHEKKMTALQEKADLDMFHPDFKHLAFMPYEIRVKWRCEERCSTCARGTHDMGVLDWGLLELGRREGREKALARMAEITDLSRYDFRLYLGNFHRHPKNFGIIGLWYPKIPEQPSLGL